MTGLPAAFSALAFASTASVADSAIAPIRREMRRSAGGTADGTDSDEVTAVMGPSCQRRPPPRRWVSGSPAGFRGRWLRTPPVPYTGIPGATDPATGVPRIHPGVRRCHGEVRGLGTLL